MKTSALNDHRLLGSVGGRRGHRCHVVGINIITHTWARPQHPQPRCYSSLSHPRSTVGLDDGAQRPNVLSNTQTPVHEVGAARATSLFNNVHVLGSASIQCGQRCHVLLLMASALQSPPENCGRRCRVVSDDHVPGSAGTQRGHRCHVIYMPTILQVFRIGAARGASFLAKSNLCQHSTRPEVPRCYTSHLTSTGFAALIHHYSSTYIVLYMHHAHTYDHYL